MSRWLRLPTEFFHHRQKKRENWFPFWCSIFFSTNPTMVKRAWMYTYWTLITFCPLDSFLCAIWQSNIHIQLISMDMERHWEKNHWSIFICTAVDEKRWFVHVSSYWVIYYSWSQQVKGMGKNWPIIFPYYLWFTNITMVILCNVNTEQ